MRVPDGLRASDPPSLEAIMLRAAQLVALLTFFSAASACGQEPPQATHSYQAFFRISYADLDEWNRQYWEYSVPILSEMQEAGDIQGWSQWEHQTGGEYNIRFTVRTFDWAAIDTFWGEYLARVEAAVPAAEATPYVIQAHYDEIWNIGEAHVPTGVQATHLYESTFRFNFGDEDEWNRMWTEVAGPILEEAMVEGLLGGWVKLDHNTGGPHNSKIVYLFEDWDDIDDLFELLLGQMAERYPDDAATMFALFRAHDDVIWVPTPPSGGTP